jgi:hypothetical protein
MVCAGEARRKRRQLFTCREVGGWVPSLAKETRMFSTKKSVRDRMFASLLSGEAAHRISRLNIGTPFYESWLQSVSDPSLRNSLQEQGLLREFSGNQDSVYLAAVFLGCVNLGLVHTLNEKDSDFILEFVFKDMYGLQAYLGSRLVECEPPGVIEDIVKQTFEIYRNVSTWAFAKEVEDHLDPIEKLIERIDLMTNKNRELAELFEYHAFKKSVVAEFYGYVRGLSHGYKMATN